MEGSESTEKKILVVDDSNFNLKVASDLLRKIAKPILVPSGERALLFLQKNQPDLILLDINMPGMSGFDVMKKIMENPKWKEIPVIFLTANQDAETEVECFKLGAVDFIVKPFQPDVVLHRVNRALEMEDYRRNLHGIIDQKVKQIEMMQYEIIIGLANLIEDRDGGTGEHVKRTSQYVSLLAMAAQDRGLFDGRLTEQYIYNLIKAAPMHDIGKISVPDAILQKPGKLTDEEFEVMKTHTTEGGRIVWNTLEFLEDTDYLKIAFNVAKYHHERWDGRGYPDHLKGEEIPLEARFMALADVFDALSTKRCYKDAFPLDKVYAIIAEGSGTQFDPILADLFCQLRPETEAILLDFGENI